MISQKSYAIFSTYHRIRCFMRFDCVICFLCMGAVVYLTAADFVYPCGFHESRVDSILWLLEFKSICILYLQKQIDMILKLQIIQYRLRMHIGCCPYNIDMSRYFLQSFQIPLMFDIFILRYARSIECFHQKEI